MPNILCLASMLWSVRRLDPIRDGIIARMVYREASGWLASSMPGSILSTWHYGI
jgi:hypothetical protein